MLAKHELLKVPLIGWTWYFLEIVFCTRKWEEDRKTVFKGLERLRDYPECMWVSKGQTQGVATGAHHSICVVSLQRHVLEKLSNMRRNNTLAFGPLCSQSC